jgi:hypothetical protein
LLFREDSDTGMGQVFGQSRRDVVGAADLPEDQDLMADMPQRQFPEIVRQTHS